MKFKIFLMTLLVLTGFVGAVDFGYTNVDGPVLLPETTTTTITTNNYINNTNASQFWITNIGSLDDVNATQFNSNAGTLTLDETWVTSFGNELWCALTGCTMAGNIDMDGNNITNGGTIDANFFIGDGSGLTGVSGSGDSNNNSFHVFINGSAYNNITYNISDGDVNDVEFTIESGKKFIFGDVYT